MAVNENRNGVRNPVLPPEHKSFVQMAESFQKDLKPVELLVSLFSRTFEAVKACILLSQHQGSLGCEIDVFCFREALVEVVQVFEGKTLSEELEFDGSKEVQEVANALLFALNGINESIAGDGVGASGTVTNTRVHYEHHSYMSSQFKNPSLFKYERLFPCALI